MLLLEHFYRSLFYVIKGLLTALGKVMLVLRVIPVVAVPSLILAQPIRVCPWCQTETGADDGDHQQPQTRQGMNQVQGPSKEPSQGSKETGPGAGLETKPPVGSKSSWGMRPGFGADCNTHLQCVHQHAACPWVKVHQGDKAGDKHA